MPKSLLESLTKQILAEAKKGDMSGGAYTEAVKMPKAKKIKEEARKGVFDNFEEWKKSFPGGTEFQSKNNYMVAMKDGEQLGKWNPIQKQGMHADDFQYKNLEETREGVFNNFEEWKKSFPGGTEFESKNNYMVAMKDGKELGKWNPIQKQGMHTGDFQYKNLEETEHGGEYKVGDKVTYLGHPAEITKVHKDVMGRTQYSLYYDKGNGKTKVSNIMSNDDSIKPVKEVAKKQHSLEELMKVKEKIEKKIMEMESSSKKADDSKHMK
jgi:hypothetical protein